MRHCSTIAQRTWAVSTKMEARCRPNSRCEWFTPGRTAGIGTLIWTDGRGDGLSLLRGLITPSTQTTRANRALEVASRMYSICNSPHRSSFRHVRPAWPRSSIAPRRVRIRDDTIGCRPPLV